MKVDILINLVRQHEEIWDKSNEDHSDSHILAALWQITMEMRITQNEATNKWKTLVTRFNSEKAKPNLLSGSDAQRKVKQWVHFDDLQFLNEQKSEASTGNCDVVVDVKDDDDNYDDYDKFLNEIPDYLSLKQNSTKSDSSYQISTNTSLQQQQQQPYNFSNATTSDVTTENTHSSFHDKLYKLDLHAKCQWKFLESLEYYLSEIEDADKFQFRMEAFFLLYNLKKNNTNKSPNAADHDVSGDRNGLTPKKETENSIVSGKPDVVNSLGAENQLSEPQKLSDTIGPDIRDGSKLQNPLHSMVPDVQSESKLQNFKNKPLENVVGSRPTKYGNNEYGTTKNDKPAQAALKPEKVEKLKDKKPIMTCMTIDEDDEIIIIDDDDILSPSPIKKTKQEIGISENLEK
ncbi:hypothetical protein TKK_0017708 [Trichogramma kaykai]